MVAEVTGGDAEKFFSSCFVHNHCPLGYLVRVLLLLCFECLTCASDAAINFSPC